MFSQVITSTENLANSITGAAAPKQAQTVVGHVKSFAAQEIPSLRSYAKSCTSFASDAGKAVAEMLAAIASGATPASLKGKLDGLVSQVNALDAQAAKTTTEMQGYRDQFNTDAANLTVAVGTLNAQVAGLRAQQAHYAQKAAELRSRIDTINKMAIYIPIVGWVIKGASELASLITESKSTEAALSEATRNLSGIMMQQAQLSATSAQVQHFETATTQLASGTQNTTNVVTMLKQQLDGEENFLNGAGDAPKLFLTATQSSLTQLSGLVS